MRVVVEGPVRQRSASGLNGEGLTAPFHDLPTGIQRRKADPRRSFSWMQAVAAQPEAIQWCPAREAEGPEPGWVLTQSSDDSLRAPGPAGEAPGGGQLLVQPVFAAQAKPAVEFPLHGLQRLSLAVLVERLMEGKSESSFCYPNHTTKTSR